MRTLNGILVGAALAALSYQVIGCGDVGADSPGDADITGGQGGNGGRGGAGGTAGSQGGGGNDAGSSDVATDARADGSLDALTENAVDTGARPDISVDAADAPLDTGTGGAGGVGTGGIAGATGKGGGSGAGAGGASGGGASGTSGASGAGGTGGTPDAGAGDAGGGTGGTGGPDASIDVVGSDGRPIIEGGRDVTTTTTEAILTAAAADCLACAQDGGMLDPTCDLTQLRCETFTDFAMKLNCLDTLACVLPPGAAVSCIVPDTVNLTPCYCGTVRTDDCTAGTPTDAGVYGVCKGYIDVGFPGQTQAFVAANIKNINYSSGRAMKIAQCMGDLLNGAGDERCRACF